MGIKTHYDGALVTLLTLMLTAAMWPFFDLFVAAVIVIGIAFSIGLRRWRDTHVTNLPAPDARTRNPELNWSTIPVAGDIGGLMFVGGCLAIFYVGIPTLRPFILASACAALTMAAAVIAWRKTHTLWSRPTTSIRAAV
jgi:hypothetical protein